MRGVVAPEATAASTRRASGIDDKARDIARQPAISQVSFRLKYFSGFALILLNDKVSSRAFSGAGTGKNTKQKSLWDQSHSQGDLPCLGAARRSSKHQFHSKK